MFAYLQTLSIGKTDLRHFILLRYHTNRQDTVKKMYICGFPCVIIVSSDERSYGCVSYRWEGSKLARGLRLFFCSVPAVKALGLDFGLYLREVGGLVWAPRSAYLITQLIDSPYIRYTKINKL